MNSDENTDLFVEVHNSYHEFINEHLSDEYMQVMYQVVASLCGETLILLSIGPSSSGKTITLNRLTAGLVQLDLNKRHYKGEQLFPSEGPDLFDHRQPVCYVRELDFASQISQNSQGLFNKTIRLAVIDTPGISNKIQLNEDIIKCGLKSLDSFLQACIKQLNDPKPHIVVVYFMKQPWCWSKVDKKLVNAIHAMYKINIFCITHALVVPDFLPSPLLSEINDFKRLDFPDTIALLEEEEAYLKLIAAEDVQEARLEFQKKWEELYKRLNNLSNHITQIRECVTDAQILLFENSPNYSTWSDIGLSNLVHKFSRSLSYNYGCLFTILTSYSLLQTFFHYLFLPTSLDRSRISKLPIEQDKRELSSLSFFQKHDMEEFIKGQLDFFTECKGIIDEIGLGVIFRISNAYFTPENKENVNNKPLSLQEDEKKSKFIPKISSESLYSCGSTFSDSGVSSSTSTSGSSDYQKKTKQKLLSLKSLWTDIFESKESGFSFLHDEVKKYSEDTTYPLNKYKCKQLAPNKNPFIKNKHAAKDLPRRNTQPTLTITNNLTTYLSPKRESLPEISQKKSPYNEKNNQLQSSNSSTNSDVDLFNSESNSIRRQTSGSNSRTPKQDDKSSSSKSNPTPNRIQMYKSKSECSNIPKKRNYTLSNSLSDEAENDQAYSNELESTLVNLLGSDRDNCMLCKDNSRDMYCPKCNRGYCTNCVKTFPNLKNCSFDKNRLVLVDNNNNI